MACSNPRVRDRNTCPWLPSWAQGAGRERRREAGNPEPCLEWLLAFCRQQLSVFYCSYFSRVTGNGNCQMYFITLSIGEGGKKTFMTLPTWDSSDLSQQCTGHTCRAWAVGNPREQAQRAQERGWGVCVRGESGAIGKRSLCVALEDTRELSTPPLVRSVPHTNEGSDVVAPRSEALPSPTSGPMGVRQGVGQGPCPGSLPWLFLALHHHRAQWPWHVDSLQCC